MRNRAVDDTTSGNRVARLATRAVRSQTIVLLASALQPQVFSEIVIRVGITKFGYLQERPVEFQQVADLFCFALYKEFDIDRLAKMAHGVPTVQKDMLALKAVENSSQGNQ